MHDLRHFVSNVLWDTYLKQKRSLDTCQTFVLADHSISVIMSTIKKKKAKERKEVRRASL